MEMEEYDSIPLMTDLDECEHDLIALNIVIVLTLSDMLIVQSAIYHSRYHRRCTPGLDIALNVENNLALILPIGQITLFGGRISTLCQNHRHFVCTRPRMQPSV